MKRRPAVDTPESWEGRPVQLIHLSNTTAHSVRMISEPMGEEFEVPHGAGLTVAVLAQGEPVQIDIQPGAVVVYGPRSSGPRFFDAAGEIPTAAQVADGMWADREGVIVFGGRPPQNLPSMLPARVSDEGVDRLSGVELAAVAQFWRLRGLRHPRLNDVERLAGTQLSEARTLLRAVRDDLLQVPAAEGKGEDLDRP